MLSTVKSCLKVSLISLILIFSLTEVSHGHRHHSYSHDGGPQADNPNWMSVLPDSVLLSELSIPGTHESVSFYGGGGVPRNLVKTQSMALKFQLDSGIRVLDIRCAIVGNHFNIYHGNIYQHENFDGILKTVVAFLKAHRGETVLMRVKEEKTNDPNRFEQNFRETYWENVNYKDYFWKSPTVSQNPTLGDMRGKLVILQDFARWQCNSPSSKAEFGICYNSFVIQDEFKVIGRGALYKKWLHVKNHLARANRGFTGPTRHIKFMNYLSGVGVSDTLGIPNPYFVVSGHSNPATGAPREDTKRPANGNSHIWPDFPRLRSPFFGEYHIYFEGPNTLTYGHLHPGWYDKRVGIIMTDFPGKGLIERIICINYPKTDPLCKRAYP